MPYKVNWYIEHEIIYARYSGATTGAEMRDCLIETKEFLDRSPRELVHIIMDVGEITQPVPLKDSMQVMRDVGPHDRAGWTITVGEKSPLAKMAAGMGASLFKLRFKAFDTIQEALDHLKFFDSTLSWEKAEESVLSP